MAKTVLMFGGTKAIVGIHEYFYNSPQGFQRTRKASAAAG